MAKNILFEEIAMEFSAKEQKVLKTRHEAL